MGMIATAITATRTSIAGSDGTGTIIGTITIGIMTGTATGIDAARLSRPIKDLPKGTV
jgi:hypothetical protein